MSNVGWIRVTSCTEVRKPAIQVQDGEMCLHSWAFTGILVSPSALEAGVVFKALHTLVFTFPSASYLMTFSPNPTPFTQVMGR